MVHPALSDVKVVIVAEKCAQIILTSLMELRRNDQFIFEIRQKHIHEKGW